MSNIPNEILDSVAYAAGDSVPASHDDTPGAAPTTTTTARTHVPHTPQEEETRRNILSQVAHAQAAAAAGRIDKAEREASRSRSRARHTGSAEGSRSNSLAREGGSTSRSGSRTRELLSKVFGGSSSRSASRDGTGRGRTEESREQSRERALAAKPLGHGTVAEGEVANLYVVGAPSVNIAKHM